LKPASITREGVVCADCVSTMPIDTRGKADLIVADPPYNIGYDYDGEYLDALPDDDYLEFTRGWVAAAQKSLRRTGSFWVVMGDEYVSEVDVICKQQGFYRRALVTWYYTFGNNCQKNFSRSHTQLLYYVMDPREFTFNADAIRVPSARQRVYKDKRANPRGRIPDNTWILRPQELPEGFGAKEDTWHIPRVAGTFKQRVEGAANQLPELLVARIVAVCSNPGDLVVDPFCGTGTTAVVAKKMQRRYLTFDVSRKFAKTASERLDNTKEGDPIWGNEEGSVKMPATANPDGSEE